MADLSALRREIQEHDASLRQAFEARMHTAAKIGAFKKEHGLPILDEDREEEILRCAEESVADASLSLYYRALCRRLLSLSRAYQSALGTEISGGRVLSILTDAGFYDDVFLRGGLSRLAELFDLSRKVLVITDDGIPEAFVTKTTEQIRLGGGEAFVYTIPAGEASKTLSTYEKILAFLAEHGFDRFDAVLGLGGGVVTDLTGFVGATYMRGMDVYAVPTTLLCMADACVGGKCAVNLSGIKNTVGVFYPPKRILTDTDLLSTLPPRILCEGYAEILKIALLFDAPLWNELKKGVPSPETLPDLLYAAVALKAAAVMQDEKEKGPRRLLNFGHTYGHALEAALGGQALHGECVAAGMLPFCSPEIEGEVSNVLKTYALPCRLAAKEEAVLSFMRADKKKKADRMTVVRVDAIGQGYLSDEAAKDVYSRIQRWMKL